MTIYHFMPINKNLLNQKMFEIISNMKPLVGGYDVRVIGVMVVTLAI